MDSSLFYSPIAEWSKVLFYLPVAGLVLAGLWKRYRLGDPQWDRWIHAAVLLHFLVGAAYSGVRMLTTDPASDMLIRRIFAAEAWFNFACAAFYFMLMRFLALRAGSSRAAP